jgi:uncharacterized protein (TIGR02444 family)
MTAWDWVVAAYDRPGVPEACLALQDAHGQNTSFLLWAVWSGTQDPARLAEAAAFARDWDQRALTPLREVRRTLKPPFPPAPDAAREALREMVKAAELRCEQVLVEALQAFGAQATATAPPLAGLQAAAQAWNGSSPAAALAALAAALG